jgi:hypothetical protein
MSRALFGLWEWSTIIINLFFNLANSREKFNVLRKKGVKFVWGNELQECFEILKRAISQPPLFVMPKFSENYILQLIASLFALGALLSEEREGFRHLISYASRTLCTQERNVSFIYDLGFLAVLFGI